MSPQFVDFDNDGRLDIVAGTFDGSPWVALGSEKGWRQPVQIMDGKGGRIVLNQYWDYDAKAWAQTNRCDAKGSNLPSGHGTSAVAWDWDGDGDLDLLLGDHDGGHLYLRENAGKPGAPKFGAMNEPVMVGKKPLNVGPLATPRLVDWDGDGRQDLLVGSMGNTTGEGEGGGVFLFRNTGSVKAPKWKAPTTLVAAGKQGSSGEPVRPDHGLYMDLADYDGDGDLDLIVGGYSRVPAKDDEPGRESFVWLYENKKAVAPATGAAPKGH